MLLRVANDDTRTSHERRRPPRPPGPAQGPLSRRSALGGGHAQHSWESVEIRWQARSGANASEEVESSWLNHSRGTDWKMTELSSTTVPARRRLVLSIRGLMLVVL